MSAPMDPVLATVAKPLATSKERKRALQKERAAERERASVQKQRAEWWQGFKRCVLVCRGPCCYGVAPTAYHAGPVEACKACWAHCHTQVSPYVVPCMKEDAATDAEYAACRKLWKCLPYICIGLVVVLLLFVLMATIFRPTPEEMELYYEMSRLREERQALLDQKRKREVLWEAAHRAYVERVHEGAYDYCEECSA